MENVKPKEVFVDQWTADLFSNFTGVNEDESRNDLIQIAEEFEDVVSTHFEGMSLNNTAEEIVDHYIASAN